jgi:hypothetical protein
VKLKHSYQTLDDPEYPTVAQISGGRTSGLMGALTHPSTLLTFQNTGLENPLTYDFIDRLEDAYERPIVRIEWRPPEKKGDAPKNFRFAEVSSKDLYRGPDLMRGMILAIKDYREANERGGLVTPWAGSRLCTTHLKHRVKDHWMASLGYREFDTYVGLRADEPGRVSDLKKQSGQAKQLLTPLYDAGIDKPAVMRFWAAQSFDLKLKDFEGNCEDCFLKNHAHLSRLMQKESGKWWIELENEFPMFGGRDFKGYAKLKAEYYDRMYIEDCLKSGDEIIPPEHLTRRQLGIMVNQEKKRLAGDVGMPCACESTFGAEDE